MLYNPLIFFFIFKALVFFNKYDYATLKMLQTNIPYFFQGKQILSIPTCCAI